jgi:hypothetical protein
MSTVKAARHHIGISATPTQNFTLTAEALDGSMKLARGNPGATTQDIMTVDNAGYMYANVVPPQFNDTNALATTSFVQRGLGNYRQGIVTNTNNTLTAAHSGTVIEIYGSSTVTQTLPLTATIGATTKICFINLGTANMNIAVQVGDQFLNNPSNTTSPIILTPGDTVEVCSFNGWVITGGSASLRNSTLFQISTSTSGWQKLPSGLIIQWGAAVATTGNGGGGGVGVTVNYPIAFPTAYRTVIASPSQTSATVCAAWTDAEGNSSVRITTNGVTSTTVRYIAIGY